jgi:hypothetical protein
LSLSVRCSTAGFRLPGRNTSFSFSFYTANPAHGITYPLVTKLAADNLTCLGKRMGLLGFLDTIGSVVGSFVAGFVMIPFLVWVKTFNYYRMY